MNIGNKAVTKIFIGTKEVKDGYIGDKKFYSGISPRRCEITGLGSEDPSDVVFTKSANFPTEAQAWEEVTIGTDKFAKFTTWYKKAIYSGDELTGFIISDTKEDNDFVPYDCFLDESGNEIDYILIGRYLASDTSAINSVDDVAAARASAASWRSLARAKGTGYQLMDAAMYMFWKDLALAISETVDFNSGSGITSYLGLDKGGNSNIGGWWIDGLAQNNGTYLYSNKPSAYVDEPTISTTGYNALSYTMPTASVGCISKLGYDANNPTINLPSATVTNNSYNTYYCDSSNYNSGNHFCDIYVGGMSAYSGLFYFSGRSNWTTSSAARLCYRHIS